MSIYDKFVAMGVSTPRTIDGAVSHDLMTTEFVDFDVDPRFHTLDEAIPGAPILGFTNKIGAPKSVTSPVYFMIRKRPFERFLTAAEQINATATDFDLAATSLTDGLKMRINYTIMNILTREILRLTATPTTVNLAVERAVGSVAAAAFTAADDELIILGYRGAEGDGIATSPVRTPELIWNYVGELQDSYEVTQYADATNRRWGGKTLEELREDKLEEMRVLLEWGILFDQRAKFQRSSDDLWVWTTGGIDSFLTENETDFSGELTEAKLIAACRAIKRHGPRERWVCASPLFMEKINLLYLGDRRLNSEVPKNVGIDIMTVRYGGLVLHFFEHPLFEDASSTADNSLRGHAFVLDMEDIELVTMKGRKMGFFRWFLNVETPGHRKIVDQLICNFGVRMALAEHHARWYNVGQ